MAGEEIFFFWKAWRRKVFGENKGRECVFVVVVSVCVRQTESKARSYPPAGARPFFETRAPGASGTSS